MIYVVKRILNINKCAIEARLVLKSCGNSDVLLTDNSDIAETFNDFFTHIGPNLAANINSSTSFDNYLTDNYPNSIFFHPVVEGDVVKEIRRLDPRKAMGHDHIHPKLIVDSVHFISRPLTHIINCSSFRIIISW